MRVLIKSFAVMNKDKSAKTYTKHFPIHPAVCYHGIQQRPMKHTSHAQWHFLKSELLGMSTWTPFMSRL